MALYLIDAPLQRLSLDQMKLVGKINGLKLYYEDRDGAFQQLQGKILMIPSILWQRLLVDSTIQLPNGKLMNLDNPDSQAYVLTQYCTQAEPCQVLTIVDPRGNVTDMSRREQIVGPTGRLLIQNPGYSYRAPEYVEEVRHQTRMNAVENKRREREEMQQREMQQREMQQREIQHQQSQQPQSEESKEWFWQRWMH